MFQTVALSPLDSSSVAQTLLATVLIVLAYLVGAPLAFAQEDVETIDGKIQVKLTESAKAQVVGAEDGLPNVVPQGRTGIAALDRRAQQFDVERMERVFRPAGKHEPRHVEWGLDRWYTVHYEADVDVESVVESYRQSSTVLESSPVYKYKKVSWRPDPDDDDPGREGQGRAPADPEQNYIPNDPEYGAQWHYNNTADNAGTPDADIDLPEAHNIETGDSEVVISVTDGGLDLDHPEFEGMKWINEEEDINNNGEFDPQPASEGGDLNGVDDDNNGFTDDVVGYDFGDDDAVPSPDGDHGTHVAGTVAAKNDNGEFGAGIAGGGNGGSGVRLMITQTFSPGGQGGFAEAITYAADNGAVVSQNSWGGGGDDPAVEDAIEYMRANAGGPSAPIDGGVAVFAAGNSSTDAPFYPAAYPESFAVAATNHLDEKAGYSNYGNYVDISAPGGNGAECTSGPSAVQSTYDGGFGPLCGTSMAAPHVSGLLGLVASANPGIGNDEAETLIEVTGEDVGSSFEIGPRINAFNALASGGSDETPPGAIDDLAVLSVSGNSADLEWVAPGDDGDTSGVASTYDLRYSTDGPIDDSTSWANATQVSGEPVPDTLGTTQGMTVSGLPFGATVHFGIRATDDFGNTGAIGNSPSADTDPAPALAFDPDSLSAELESGQDTSLGLTLTNDGPSGSTLSYSFPDFAAQDLLARPGVERNNTASVIGDAGYDRQSGDPHAGIGHPVLTGAGGPDEFGYSWIDSNEPGGPSFAFDDISDVGTATGIGDLESIEVDLPFTFEYYGEPQSTLNINNNGFVFFEGALGAYFSNDEIPNTADPNGVIAAFWDDLDPSESGAEVYTYHDESAGEFIVQWDEVPAFFGDVPMTFQIILSEDGSIRYNILDIDEGDNNSATTGIENLTGEVGLQVAFNTAYVEDSLSVSIAATPDFITDVTPASGTVGGGSSEDVDVTFDATGIDPGTYETGLALASNDPDNMTASIPSTLSVISGPPAIALEPDSLDFGQVLVGSAATETFTVTNSGGGPLSVSSVTFPEGFSPVDSADTGPFTLAIGETRDVGVQFGPDAADTFSGEVVVNSDADNDPSAPVFVEGEGVPAPDIAVSPSSISDSLGVGDSSETTLTVSNNGGSELEFSTTIETGSTPDATAPGEVAGPAASAGSGDASALGAAGDSYVGQPTDVGQTATMYQVDDGNSENGLGLTNGGDFMWLNAFQVVEGAGTITEISSAWGGANSSGLPTDKPVSFLIYEDPNDDGDPSDAVLLEQVTTEVQDPHTDEFTTESISPTQVEGVFFVAALYEEQPGDAFPAPMDESSEYQGVSWAVGNTAGNFNAEDLSANDVGPDNLGDIGFAANWLLRAEGGANFVAVEPSAGTVPAGSSLDLAATFDATGLTPDIYEAAINFDSNDPDDSPSVDATLEVAAGPPAIALEPDSLDFGSLLVGDDTTGTFTISNTGGEPLEVSSVSFPEGFSPVDSADTGPFTIPFEGSRDIEVQFAPDAAEVFSGDIVVESNADNDPSAAVFAEGEGLPVPGLAFSPDSLAAELESGQDTSVVLTVTNDGAAGSTLGYSFPDFAADALFAKPDVERNNTSSVIGDASHEKGSDPHAGIGHPVLTGAGGPDAFGYSWIDSNEPGGPSFAFDDISDVGTATGIGDLESIEVDLPFTFEYYGEPQSTLNINNNGFVFFEGALDGYFVNDEIPNTADPNGVIAAFWDDLDPSESGAKVYTYHDESAGEFIVQWDEVPAFVGDVPMTFQIILSEDGSIRYNYLDIDEDDNASATTGIEDAAGEVGLQVAFNTAYVEDSLSVSIAATPDFITDVTPASGTLGGGESDDVDVTFSAEDIEPGTYETGLALASNDPDNMTASIPSTLSVISGPPAIALEPDSLDFGSVLVGNATTATFTIDNSGGGPLEVSSVNFPESYEPVDSADTGPFTVPFGESRDVEARFAPSATGTYPDSIVVQSDASNDPSAPVFVTGEAVPAPDIAVSPTSISDSLGVGDSSETTLTVSNNGGSALEFTATIETGSTPDATAPGEVAGPAASAGSREASALGAARAPYDGQPTDVGRTATTYQVDDGSSENGLGLTDGGDFMWLNAYQVVEGAGTITEISSAWGGANNSGLPTDKPVSFLIYEDPNDDGDPSDAVLLEQVTTEVQDPHTDEFTTESISPTQVEGVFFVAALYEEQPEHAFPAPMDESSEYQGASWVVGNTNNNFNIDDLPANDVGPDNLSDIGFPANWLLRAEGGANFVAVEPSAGTVPADSSLDLAATFDATGLTPGIYEAAINFDSNDPDDSPSVDATLEASLGPAAIGLEPDSLNFGSLLVGEEATGEFTVENTGGEPLEVSSVSFPEGFSPVDSADTGPFTIPFEGSRDIEVQFAPDAAEAFSGDIVVESNADNDPSAAVFVEGEGLPAPELAYSPDTLSADLASGDSATVPLTVSNDGPSGSMLEYTFPDFVADALFAKPDVERNNTSSVIDDASYDRQSGDPHAGIGHPVRTGAGGPDAFGYSWIDSNEPGGPSFAFNDISDVGTALDITDDFGASPSPEVDLPIDFEFYGESKSTVRVDNNGFLHFDSPSDNYFSNDEIPHTGEPNGVVAAFWDDLDPSESGAEVYTYHDESAGEFIVQWDEVPAFVGDVPMTFQIILSEDGSIRYNYLDIDEADNSSATTGIEDAAGEVGLQVAFNTAYVEDSLSVSIAATPDFITDVTPASGTVGGGSSEDVDVTFDATGIDPGTYEAGLALSTNDLDESSVEVPSQLTVSETPGDCPLSWSLDIATTDSSGFEETLTLGQGPNATAGLDGDCGEVEQPPLPPEEESDFRFVGTGLPGVELGEGTLTDIRPDDEPTPEATNAPAIWRVSLQGTYPVSMNWDSDALAGATDRPVELVDAATGGDVVSVDMKNTGSATIENSAVSAVEVRLGQTTSHEMVMVDGWNFKSMPVMTSDMSFGTMDPCFSGFAYIPGEGYEGLEDGDAMAMGEGYWFNCEAASHTVTGTVPSPPTAEVGAGWNVVGPYADSVEVSSITSDPEGIVESAFFGFGQSSGYTAAETLAPAQAYWVKTSASGTLTFSGSGGASATLAAKAATSADGADRPETLRLAVTDAEGHEATVRLAEGLSEQKLQRSAMPPKPPSGAFDVRFESGRSVASFEAGAEASDALETLELQGVTYPLTLRLENADEQGQSLRLKRGSGEDVETRTLTAESPSVTLQSEAGPVKVAPRSVPEEFALNGSYPNPVSAQATIEYAVPEQSDVTVEVYDVLGRRVATLVSGEKKAGEHSVRLDAQDLSSGTYFYRMRAGDFTQTRRLVVVR